MKYLLVLLFVLPLFGQSINWNIVDSDTIKNSFCFSIYDSLDTTKWIAVNLDSIWLIPIYQQVSYLLGDMTWKEFLKLRKKYKTGSNRYIPIDTTKLGE